MATYVFSDVHGLQDRFDKLIEYINPEQDKVYVLGDVIDRGPKGIQILQYIKEHQDTFTLVMGNHELMMVEYFDALGTPNETNCFMNWIMNGCTMTLGAFNNLSDEEKNELINYLKSLPVAYTNIIINNKTFYLVHGAPVKTDKEIVYYGDEDFNMYDFMWNRCEAEHEIENKTVIFGHTISYFYQQDKKPFEIWFNKDTLDTSTLIDIDCGCASRDDNSRLCLLRLDDLQVVYF